MAECMVSRLDNVRLGLLVEDDDTIVIVGSDASLLLVMSNSNGELVTSIKTTSLQFCLCCPFVPGIIALAGE